MTDLKQAVYQLMNAIHDLRLEGSESTLREALANTRAALAQPEPETDDFLTNYPKVTRVEVITSKGREFVRYECTHVQFSLQDDGRTIKVFLSSND